MMMPQPRGGQGFRKTRNVPCDGLEEYPYLPYEDDEEHGDDNVTYRVAHLKAEKFFRFIGFVVCHELYRTPCCGR